MSENEREQIILALTPLVHSTCNRALHDKSIRGIERDDLKQELWIVAIKAVDSYDADKGATLSTWVTRCMENALRQLINQSRKTVPTVQLDNCAAALNIAAEDEIARVDTRIALEQLLPQTPLSELSRRALEMRFYGDKTNAEIARELDCSRTHAGRLIAHGTEILRDIVSRETSIA